VNHAHAETISNAIFDMTYDQVVEVLRSWLGHEVSRDHLGLPDSEVISGTLHEGHVVPPQTNVIVGERYEPDDRHVIFTISRSADPEKTPFPFGVACEISRRKLTGAEWVPGAEGRSLDLMQGHLTTRWTRHM
jgi:hypothetical protein